MAKKKPTARQRDIERLAKDYQASVTGLEPEYQSVFGKKTEVLSDYEEKSKKYGKKLENYQKALQEYKKSPIQELSFSVGAMASPDAGKNVKIQPNEQYDWRSQTMHRVPELNNDFYTPYALELLGYEVTPNRYGTLESAIKRNPKPTFAEKAPEAPDTSAFDTELEQLQAKRKTLGEGFEREKAERKSSQIRAVSQRSRERPMLSKGVTI